MQTIKIIFVLGFVVLVVPFLGIPGSWKTVASIACGCLICSLAYSLLHQKIKNTQGETISKNSDSAASRSFAERTVSPEENA